MPPSDPREDSHCQNCGAKLDASLLGGSCPACMWTELINDDSDGEPLDDRPDIAGYEVFEELGSGGMGIVYRARQENPAREVALKVVAPYTLRAVQARQRFMLEVDAMAAVEHPAILPLYDAGEDEAGRPWLTMQLAQGGTLANRLDDYQKDWQSIAGLIVLLAGAVHYAHERGILHRDLKPANILFDSENNPYIADFGLAKWADEDASITRSSYLLGSPAYLAPEAAAGGSKVTTTVSDVYGLGAILYELLCGKKPYEGTVAAEVLTQILDKAPAAPRSKLPAIPRDLEVIVMKAMARDPEKRYHSAAALADDINRWREGKAIYARPVGITERCWIWVKRNPSLAILSLLLLGSLISGTALLWQSNKKLSRALNDAEERVDFMTRELPAKLEPLGRLDLLDDVFENVSEHYEMNHRTDPQSLSRHADFLTQWAQILRPRGQIKESIDRLEQAIEKARTACESETYPLEAARAKVRAGRRLGEALIEYREYDRARVTLAETVTFSEGVPNSYKEDPRLQVLTAELFLEMAILEHKSEEPNKALEWAKKSLSAWASITPELLKNSNSTHREKALISAATCHYFIARIYQTQGSTAQEGEHIQRYHEKCNKLVTRSPSNLLFQREWLISRQLLINFLTKTKAIKPEQVVERIQEVDNDILILSSQDPGNIRWRTDAVNNALRMTKAAEQLKDDDLRSKWMKTLSQRLEPLYKIHTTDLTVLYTQRDAASHCGYYHLSRDWQVARLHLNAAHTIHMKICLRESNVNAQKNLHRMTYVLASLVGQHEGKSSALKWLGARAIQFERTSISAEKPALWMWSLAHSQRLIAMRSDDEEVAHRAHQKGFYLLMDAAEQFDEASALSEDGFYLSKFLLGSKQTSPKVRQVALARLLNVLPALRKKTTPERDHKWLDVLVEVLTKIPQAERKALVAKTIEQFFPKPVEENAHYQKLEQLDSNE